MNKYFQTTDLSLATALSLSFPLEGIDKTIPTKSLFLFTHSEGLDQFIESYWRGDIKVNPSAFFNQLKIIKTRLYENG